MVTGNVFSSLWHHPAARYNPFRSRQDITENNMKLNIGCGFNKLDGYINVDQFPECNPDVLWNLEETPWPFEEGSVEELVAHHVLEHLGQETKMSFAIFKELCRLMRHDGVMRITVPRTPITPHFCPTPPMSGRSPVIHLGAVPDN
jgi:hypothetical protein